MIDDGGTFTIRQGTGVSDPVRYNADIETVQAAFNQAAIRDKCEHNWKLVEGTKWVSECSKCGATK